MKIKLIEKTSTYGGKKTTINAFALYDNDLKVMELGIAYKELREYVVEVKEIDVKLILKDEVMSNEGEIFKNIVSLETEFLDAFGEIKKYEISISPLKVQILNLKGYLKSFTNKEVK